MPYHQAIFVVDLAFGDCGKGTIVDYLARTRRAHTVVRFNGGPQAGHNVITPDGRHHTFSQFGAGSFVPGVRTLLSRFMLIEPYAMLNEAAHLQAVGVVNPLSRLLIDHRCLVITPAQQAANRLREMARGEAAHGTCGQGVGETMQDLSDHPSLIIRAADLNDRPMVKNKLRAILDLKREQLRPTIDLLAANHKANQSVETLLDDSWIDAATENYLHLARHVSIVDEGAIAAALRSEGTILFEGAQGVLLDETFGFHPHTTWSNTTFANADALLNEAGSHHPRLRIGVLRCYATRHGSGPFVTEDASLFSKLPELHNHNHGWQGRFRVGAFDAVAARYAITAAGPVDLLAITHLDRRANLPDRMCTGYRIADERDKAVASATDEFFVRTDGIVTDIAARDALSLTASQRRTNMLLKAAPIYSRINEQNPITFVKRICDQLRVQVGIVSSGPSANDKELLERLSP